jgi:outer membrane protein assembly factor BamB
LILIAACLCLVPRPLRAEWPEFRGPWGNGHAAAPDDARPLGLPLRWSEQENVGWKTPIPHRGWSTPVVLGGQVWLTTATLDGHDFFAISVDAETGRIRFNRRLFHADAPEPLGNAVNCYASPTPAIEPGRVYVHFGSYGTACLDTATFKVLWERRDLVCRHYRGPASSCVLFENLLILSMDGVDVQYLAALDKRTGRTVWKTDRTAQWNDLDPQGQPFSEGDLRKAFSTPLVIDAGGRPQLVSLGAKAGYAYDPRTGRELWKVHYAGHSSAPRPVFGRGLALIATGHGTTELWAVRVDGRGDVTGTHVAWKATRSVPLTASPLLVDDLVYMVSDDGIATCLEVATGKEVWKRRLGGNYSASPIYADGRLYFSSQQGKTFVLRPGRSFEVLATNALDSGFMASPAVSGKALLLRTKTHLYRIESAPAI